MPAGIGLPVWAVQGPRERVPGFPRLRVGQASVPRLARGVASHGGVLPAHCLPDGRCPAGTLQGQIVIAVGVRAAEAEPGCLPCPALLACTALAGRGARARSPVACFPPTPPPPAHPCSALLIHPPRDPGWRGRVRLQHEASAARPVLGRALRRTPQGGSSCPGPVGVQKPWGSQDRCRERDRSAEMGVPGGAVGGAGDSTSGA